jgi:hypothetical protein
MTTANPDALYWVTLREAEKSMLVFYLENCGTLTGAAKALGVGQPFISKRCIALGIDPILITRGRPAKKYKKRKKKRVARAKAKERQDVQEPGAVRGGTPTEGVDDPQDHPPDAAERETPDLREGKVIPIRDTDAEQCNSSEQHE